MDLYLRVHIGIGVDQLPLSQTVKLKFGSGKYPGRHLISKIVPDDTLVLSFAWLPPKILSLPLANVAGIAQLSLKIYKLCNHFRIYFIAKLY